MAALQLVTGVKKQQFSLMATKGSALHNASAPSQVSGYDGLQLINDPESRPLMFPPQPKKKEQAFQTDSADRQEARRNRYLGLATKAMDLKSLCGDEVMIVFKNADKVSFSVFTTLTDLTFNPNPSTLPSETSAQAPLTVPPPILTTTTSVDEELAHDDDPACTMPMATPEPEARASTTDDSSSGLSSSRRSSSRASRPRNPFSPDSNSG